MQIEMYIEIILIAIILFGVLIYNQTITTKQFVSKSAGLFDFLKEKDYEFLLLAKYGDRVYDVQAVFMKRIKNAGLTMAVILLINLNNLSYISLIITVVAGFFVFKMDYMNLKSYYKQHLNTVDALLPYYLKSIEILVQHYTVPVALAKSIEDAPEVFKDGLKELVAKIEAGDSSVDPYMEFAEKYPVRDSMRMMRLLYRLGLGEQEQKHQQLISFSKSVSSLQEKAREQKYKERLGKMEKKTMTMLVCTGAGSMVLLVVAMVMLLANNM